MAKYILESFKFNVCIKFFVFLVLNLIIYVSKSEQDIPLINFCNKLIHFFVQLCYKVFTRPFNTRLNVQKVFITPIIITCIHFFLIVCQFNLNFRNKYFIKNMMNQVIERFFR